MATIVQTMRLEYNELMMLRLAPDLDPVAATHTAALLDDGNGDLDEAAMLNAASYLREEERERPGATNYCKIFQWGHSRSETTDAPVVELGAHVATADGRRGVVAETRGGAQDEPFRKVRVLLYDDSHRANERGEADIDPAATPLTLRAPRDVALDYEKRPWQFAAVSPVPDRKRAQAPER